jgi:hypothetical protein
VASRPTPHRATRPSAKPNVQVPSRSSNRTATAGTGPSTRQATRPVESDATLTRLIPPTATRPACAETASEVARSATAPNLLQGPFPSRTATVPPPSVPIARSPPSDAPQVTRSPGDRMRHGSTSRPVGVTRWSCWSRDRMRTPPRVGTHASSALPGGTTRGPTRSACLARTSQTTPPARSPSSSRRTTQVSPVPSSQSSPSAHR